MRIPRQVRIAPVIALAAIAVVATVSAACDGDSEPSAPAALNTPAPGETPPPLPTPTVAPADLALADALRYEGAFEDAINVYGSVAAQGEAEHQQQARLAQAQLLGRTQRFDEARVTLDAYLAAAAADGEGSSAQYMLASTLDDLGDPQGALIHYDRYITAGGPASSFARIERAKMLARLARFPEAEAAAAEVLGLDIDEGFKASFMLSFGSALEAAGADAAALAWYDRAVASPTGDGASQYAARAAVKQRLGDPTWVDDRLTIVARYPESGVAAASLDALDAAGVPVSDYARGYVDYRAFRNAAARVALSAAVAAGDNPAAATYYLGAIDEREGNFDAAIANYVQAFLFDPAHPLADDALWWRGRLLELAARTDEAVAVFAQLVDGYPRSEWVADAQFHRGLALFRRGDHADAALVWSAFPSASDDDEAQYRARFWQGRAQLSTDDEAGKATLEALHADAPENFYGLRAEVLLEENDDRVKDPDLDDGDPDWEEIADFVAEAVETPTPATPVATPAAIVETASADPLAEVRWAEAAELRTVGLRGQADAVLLSIVNDYEGDLPAQVEISRRLQESGLTSLASRSATRLILALPDDAPEPPDGLLRVAYPLAFIDLVEDAAKEEDVPPLLLLALMRQESFYDPDAGSSAGALGLTQVIPTTGQSIADVLGVTAFDPSDLFRPRLSLRFGANYLSSQLTSFDGNAYHALAAYNGGPGTASNAIDTAGEDVDLFVEDLEFDETRAYVKLVLEHYARYRQLYEDDVNRPSIDQ